MLTEADILHALRDCYDPDLALNIVDLGLIDRIDLTPAPDAPGANIPGVPPPHRVDLTLTPTSPDETKTAQLTAQISNRLAGIESVAATQITLSNETWTPARLTPQARKLLNLDSPFPILNRRIL